MQAHTYKEVPTVKKEPFDPSVDALALRKAMKGLGTDEDAIINILAKRTDSQRQEIMQTFNQALNRNLVKDLKSELSGRFRDTVSALMRPRAEYLATRIEKCIGGDLFWPRVLVDILCTASNEEIHKIRAAFIKIYDKMLESFLTEETKGSFKHLLVTLCKGDRQEDLEVSRKTATSDAKVLSSEGKSQVGTDQDKFIEILCMRSFPQLRLMFREYRLLTGQSVENAILEKYAEDDDTRMGLLAIVASARNRALYFAHRLRQSVEGAGTWDKDLIRIVVTRTEIDLGNIKTEYEARYGKTLAKDISGDTSGDYRKLLLALVGEN